MNRNPHRGRTGVRPAWGSRTVAAACVALLVACGSRTEADHLERARQFVVDNDRDAAVKELKTLLQSRPQSVDGRLLLGKLQWESGLAADAEATLRTALEQNAPRERVLPLLATAMNAQGKGAALLKAHGSTVLPDRAAEADFKIQLAAAARQAGDADAAERYAAIAEGVMPDATAVVQWRARQDVREGRLDQAIERTTKLVARQPGDAIAWAAHAEALASKSPQQPSAQAIDAWRRSLAANPRDLAVHASMIGALLLRDDLPQAEAAWKALAALAPRHVQTVYLEALLAERRGDVARTRELAQALVRSAPDNVRVLMLAGRAEEKAGGLELAQQYFAKAFKAAPEAPSAGLALARVQLRGGQFDDALQTLKPLIDAASPRPEVLLLAAHAQMARGRQREADDLLRRAEQVGGTSDAWRTAMAAAKLAKGQHDEGVRDLAQVARAASSSGPALMLVDAHLRQQDWKSALDAIDLLEKKSPGEARASHIRGQALLQTGNEAGARAAFEEALKREADYAPALLALTALDMRANESTKARERLQAAITRNPRNAQARLLLVELLQSERGDGGAAAQQLLEEGVRLAPTDVPLRRALIDLMLARGKLDDANSLAQVAVSALPREPELVQRLGAVQLRRKDHQQAQATFVRLVALKPDDLAPRLQLAQAYAAGDKLPLALATLDEAKQRFPQDAAVSVARVMLLKQAGKSSDALAAARELQKADRARGLQLEADLLADAGDHAGALKLRQQHFDAAPSSSSAVALYAALHAASRANDAEAIATSWRQSHPEDLGFVMALADANMLGGRRDRAEALYREVMAKRPDNLTAINNVAYLLATQGKPEAVELARRVVAAQPDSAPLVDTLALALASQKQWPQAIEAQQKVVRLAPSNPAYRLQLARFLLDAGDRTAALEQIELLEKLGPSFSGQPEVSKLRQRALN